MNFPVKNTLVLIIVDNLIDYLILIFWQNKKEDTDAWEDDVFQNNVFF